MIKKSLFKKITALALATCLATSPAVIYAADDAEAVFVEQETVTTDEASSDEGYAEEVFKDDTQILEDVQDEDTVSEEIDFAGDVVEEDNNEPVFVEESEVTEDSATEDVAAAEEAFGVDDETMAQIMAGGNDIYEDESVIDNASADIDYAGYTVTYYGNGGTIGTSQSTYAVSDVTGEHTVLGNGTTSFARTGYVFKNWNTNSTGTGTIYEPGTKINITANFSLYATWDQYVAQNGTTSTSYKSLAEAVSAASENDTIKLLTNNTLEGVVPIGETIKLDLNGFKIENKSGTTLASLLSVSAGKTLTIINSSATAASITNALGNAVTTAGTLNIGNDVSGYTNFTITGAGDAAIKTSGAGAVSMTGGTVTGSSGNGIYFGSTGNLTISAGTITGTGYAGLYVDGLATVGLTGGTYTGSYGIEVATAPSAMTATTAILTGSTIKLPNNYVWILSGTDTNTLKPIGTALGTAGATVKLYSETVLDATAEVGSVASAATLDLNGKKLSNGSNYVSPLINLQTGSNLNIIDSSSSGSGSITNSMTNGSVFSYDASATATLSLGSNTSKAFTISSDGDTIIDAGATASTLNVNKNTTIKSTSGNAISAVDTVKVNDGTITGGTNGIAMSADGDLEFKGGTITPGTGAAILIGAALADIEGETTINGGTLNGTTKLSVVGASLSNTGSVKVYNTGVVEASSVAIDSGCFWVKGSLDTFTTLKGVTAYNNDEEDGDKITLAGKIKDAPTLAITKKVTLDLNGQSFTTVNTATSSIEVTGGSLTIIDSVGGGKIENTHASGYGIYVTGSTASTLVLGETSKSNFTVSSKSDAVLEGNASTSESTTITINGGTYDSTSADYAIHKSGKGVLTINDGTFDGSVADIYAENGTINIKGGTYENTCNVSLLASDNLTAKVYNSAVDISDDDIVTVVGDYLWATDSSNVSTLTALNDVFAKAGTVKLTNDIHTPFDVSAKVTLDLNGHNVTATSDYMIGIKKGGDLTIINSDTSTTNAIIGSGVISGTTYNAKSAIKMLSSGSSSSPVLTVGSTSDTTLNNITITGSEYGIYDAVACTTTVNGGEINGGTSDGNAGIKHDAGTLTVVNGEVKGKDAIAFGGNTSSTATLKGGIFTGERYAVYENNEKLSSLKISGGSYYGETGAVQSVSDKEAFLAGGVYSDKPSKDYVASGYGIEKNTDSGAATYPWRVYSSSPHATLTLAHTPTAASTAPSSDPTDLEDLEEGTVVTLTAKPATTGYTFDGWYRGTTRLATTTTYRYTTTAADVTLTAVYTKDLTVTIKDDEVVSGSAYEPKNTVDSLTVTGLDGSDTAATVLDVSAMKLTSTYNKDTSAIGTTYPITQTGLKIKTSNSTLPKYNLKSTTNGTLTVIAGTGPEEFIAEVNKLPAATAVTVDNLAATKTAVEKAKADYAKLSTASKNLDTVKAAKTKLDAVDAAVTKLDTDKKAADAADALIKALPDPKNATSADREALDAANEAYKALTDEQKKMVPDADREKLAQVEAAVKAAEKADQEAAAAVKNLIDALPSVTEATAADRDALTEAQEAYAALTPAQKKLLPGAEATLEALDEVITAAENDQKAADAVTAKINALPDPEKATADDRAAVNEAKDALAALTPAQQKLVPDAAKQRLEAVDEAVKAKEGGDDQKAADACMEKIEAIKKQPAGKGKAATEEARAAYDALTDAQKALLPKSAESLLTAAEEAYTKDRTFQCGDNWYKVLPSGNVSYNRPADSDCTSATVPNQIKKNGYMYKVVKVSIGAFKNCTSLEWVVINKNIQIIGEYAFKNTPSLTKIKVLTRQLKAGKVVKAFAAGGKSNGAKLTVKTPSTYVAPYDSLFKGEGLLNQKATVKAA